MDLWSEAGKGNNQRIVQTQVNKSNGERVK